MLKFYKLNYLELNKIAIHYKISKLPNFCQDKIFKYSSLLKQQQRLEGLQLLQKVLFDNNFNLQHIYYNKYGKPMVDQSIDFSLSYANNNVVLGFIKNGAIGVDIEQIKTINILDFIDYFSEYEFHYLSGCNNSQTIFYKLWTRKEAVAKAVGKGAMLDFKSFEVLNDDIEVNNLQITISSELIQGNYWISVAVFKKLN